VTDGSPDLTSLVAGVAILALGAMLLLHAVGGIELSFGILAPVVCAATGAILVASGMSRLR
jgi:ribose/xylose/arabinose/galactoside ABC-type transport system permease subunit